MQKYSFSSFSANDFAKTYFFKRHNAPIAQKKYVSLPQTKIYDNNKTAVKDEKINIGIHVCRRNITHNIFVFCRLFQRRKIRRSYQGCVPCVWFRHQSLMEPHADCKRYCRPQRTIMVSQSNRGKGLSGKLTSPQPILIPVNLR